MKTYIILSLIYLLSLTYRIIYDGSPRWFCKTLYDDLRMRGLVNVMYRLVATYYITFPFFLAIIYIHYNL